MEVAPCSHGRYGSHRLGCDLVGLALSQLSDADALIVVATLVCGVSDRSVQRLVPQADWRRNRRPARLRTVGPTRERHGAPRRIAAAHLRLEWTIRDLNVRDEVVRALITVDAAAYTASPAVRALCDANGLHPGPQRRCAAPGCSAELRPPDSRGGRPRITCSDRCRQRLARARRL